MNMSKTDILEKIIVLTEGIAKLEAERTRLSNFLVGKLVTERSTPTPAPMPIPPPAKPIDLPRCDVEVNMNFTSARARNASESELLQELQSFFRANPDKKVSTSVLVDALHRGHTELRSRLTRLVKTGFLLTGKCRGPRSNRTTDGFWLNPNYNGKDIKNPGLPIKASKPRESLAPETYETIKNYVLLRLREISPITLKDSKNSPTSRTTFYLALQRMVEEGLLVRSEIPNKQGKRTKTYRLPPTGSATSS